MCSRPLVLSAMFVMHDDKFLALDTIQQHVSPFISGHKEGNFPEKAGARRGEMLSCDRVKMFTDGALGSDTAALSLPYVCSHNDNKGVLIHSQVKLQ